MFILDPFISLKCMHKNNQFYPPYANVLFPFKIISTTGPPTIVSENNFNNITSSSISGRLG